MSEYILGKFTNLVQKNWDFILASWKRLSL